MPGPIREPHTASNIWRPATCSDARHKQSFVGAHTCARIRGPFFYAAVKKESEKIKVAVEKASDISILFKCECAGPLDPLGPALRYGTWRAAARRAVVLAADIFIGGRGTCNRPRGIRTQCWFVHLYPRGAYRPIHVLPGDLFFLHSACFLSSVSRLISLSSFSLAPSTYHTAISNPINQLNSSNKHKFIQLQIPQPYLFSSFLVCL